MLNDDAFQSLFATLNNETTVLTPNRRLSATLHKLYQTHQLTHHTCWKTPDIIPFSTWVQRLWRDDKDLRMDASHILLSPSQEDFLWEKVISQSKHCESLLQISETADIAKSAYGLLKQWQVDVRDPRLMCSDDYHALSDWMLEFQTTCHAHQWLDNTSIAEAVIESIRKGEIIPSKNIILFGFSELSPQWAALLESCRAAGCSVRQVELTHCAQSVNRVIFPENKDELQAIARFAKAIHEKEPTARIGCVFPNLDQIRDMVVQTFSEVFAEQDEYLMAPAFSPINISVGKTLLHYPLIQAAFQLLSLHKKNLTVATFSYLLSSPFVGEAESEQVRRANFDGLLRRSNISSINLKAILDTSSDAKMLSLHAACPKLAARIQAFLVHLHSAPVTQSHSKWASLISHALKMLGWPGERSVSSEEYQMIDHWLRLLEEFSLLDQVAKPTKFSDSLQTLQKMAAKMIFQPQTPEAPIQLLGLLEAAALPFDYLWVAGMDDMSWPPQPKPNPLIPKRLQRELNMPHATALRELQYCEQLLQQFIHSSPEVIFSHASTLDDLELQASPLIRDYTETTLEQLMMSPFTPASERIFQAKAQEATVDETAPPVAPNEKIRGGVSVLKHQALCPFRAFAEWRLHAHELEQPLPGLRAKERGTLIHKALELTWNAIQDHASLCSLKESDLTQIIHTAIAQAIEAFQQAFVDNEHYLTLEKQRVFKLIWEWLQIEKQRLPFTVMKSEKSESITLNQLQLSIRIDRIDELHDGTKVIIDYKTGKNNDVKLWFSERPEEPQLPLYALLDPDKTAAITFAQLYPGNSGFKGISRHTLDIPGIQTIAESKKTATTSWDEQITEWKVTLTKLSDDFYAGVAKVDPKDKQETCAWCALKPLCRVNEQV